MVKHELRSSSARKSIQDRRALRSGPMDDQGIIVVPEASYPFLLQVYVSEPCANPPENSLTVPRPNDIVGDIATAYSATCPFCNSLLTFSTKQITHVSGKDFVRCPSCNIGPMAAEDPEIISPSQPEFDDPFCIPEAIQLDDPTQQSDNVEQPNPQRLTDLFDAKPAEIQCEISTTHTELRASSYKPE